MTTHTKAVKLIAEMQQLRGEMARLRDDIETYVQMNTDLTAQCDQLRAKCEAWEPVIKMCNIGACPICHGFLGNHGIACPAPAALEKL